MNCAPNCCIILLGVTLLKFLTACAPVTKNSESTPQAHVTSAVLKKAGKITSNIDYLPTKFVEDGCYARSLYVSMELAVADIPSSAQIVSTCHSDRDASDLLELPDGTKWNWHVAPLFLVDGKPYIIDLSFSKTPMERKGWAAKFSGNSSQNKKRYFQAKPASQTAEGWGSASPEVCGKDLGLDTLVSRTKDMKRFAEINFLTNCLLMASHIRKEPDYSTEQKEKKVQRLLKRTVELHKLLKVKELLDPSDGNLDGYRYKTPADYERFKEECLPGVPEK